MWHISAHFLVLDLVSGCMLHAHDNPIPLAELARRLGVSRQYLNRRIGDGMPAERDPRGRWLVTEAAARAWLASDKRTSKSACVQRQEGAVAEPGAGSGCGDGGDGTDGGGSDRWPDGDDDDDDDDGDGHRSNGEPLGSPGAELARLNRLRSEKIALEIRQRMGDLVNVHEMKQVYFNRFNRVSRHLRALGKRVGPRAAGILSLSDRSARIIRNEIEVGVEEIISEFLDGDDEQECYNATGEEKDRNEETHDENGD